MRSRCIWLLGVIVLTTLLLVPGIASEETTTPALIQHIDDVEIQIGTNLRLNISIYSSIDQDLKLVLSTAQKEYFVLNQSEFHIPEDKFAYAELQISVPGDAEESTLNPVLSLYEFDSLEDSISPEPIHTVSFRLEIVDATASDDKSDYILPILLIIFGILEVGGILFLLWTRSRKYKDFKIRDVFIIYKDGRLIKHISTHSEASLDHFTVSSMLTAISNYINDSFRAEKTGSRYGELQHGDLRVLVEHGDNVDLAVVVSGDYPPKLKRIMARTLTDIESTYSLKKWDGDYALFVNLNDVIRPLIMMHKEKMFSGKKQKALKELPVEAPKDNKAADGMSKYLIASGAFPPEAKDDLKGHLGSLDESQMESFYSVMEHLARPETEDGKKIVFVDLPGDKLIRPPEQ